jgi:hypothetical protein
MTREDPEERILPKLVSVPGLLAAAVLGVAAIVLSRLFGPENFLREVLTELVASFGSTILVLAIFGLLFRSGLERLFRAAPGGESLVASADRLGEILQQMDRQAPEAGASRDEGRLDRIESGVRSLTENEVPALRAELEDLRRLLTERGG